MPALVSHALAAPTAGVYRVARSAWPFEFHPGEPLVDPGRPVEGGSRWDDPLGQFATLYCASTAEAAFAETIARYRERGGLLERIDTFLSGSPDPDYDFELEPGKVPGDYFEDRYLGHVQVDGEARFVDLEHADTHTAGRHGLLPQLREFGVTRFDRGTVASPDRRVTRTIARYYHELSRKPDHQSWRGLRYLSRLDAGWECWAVWEPTPLSTTISHITTVTRTHPALHGAAARLGLRL
jgi:hypothetical protein